MSLGFSYHNYSNFTHPNLTTPSGAIFYNPQGQKQRLILAPIAKFGSAKRPCHR